MIVGHVDTKTGPSVFYDLGKLHPGDLIEVARADESVVVFRIDTVEHFPKDQLPAERIYGHDGPPGLRLITCGGQFIGGRTGYADNVIAFATLQSSRSPEADPGQAGGPSARLLVGLSGRPVLGRGR